MGTSRILIMDEVEVHAGSAGAFHDAYLQRYAPGAKKRGMTLESSWRTPVADIPERPATLYFIWSVPDSQAWWAMRVGTDDEKKTWWHSVEDLILRRRRLFLTDLAGEAV
jgi:hypothetical protein